MIIVDEDAINNLREACDWLKEAWIYEPYNIWYESFGDYECINIEPTRDNYDSDGWTITNIEEFAKFVR